MFSTTILYVYDKTTNHCTPVLIAEHKRKTEIILTHTNREVKMLLFCFKISENSIIGHLLSPSNMLIKKKVKSLSLLSS